MGAETGTRHTTLERQAYQFIILMGLISFFGDVTYESGRGIAGPYLATLGASAALVGLVSGLGEFVGYALRLVAGVIADRTRLYWPLTFLGYGLLIAVPLLAWIDQWPLAAGLLVLERVGKAIRSPARDTLLSHATSQVGRGWGFAIHEAIDQFGGVIGPLMFSAALAFGGGYRQGFNLLWISVLLCLATLTFARLRFPTPETLEKTTASQQRSLPSADHLPHVFWVYSVFILLTVGGFTNFQIIAFHLSRQGVVAEATIPLLYAVAMGTDALFALGVGKLYDRIGLRSLIIAPLLTLPIPLLALTQQASLVWLAVILWGAVMGTHETTLRAAVADLTPTGRRGSAYGLFNTVYGGAWFLGGVWIGWAYDTAPGVIGIAVMALQIVAALVILRLPKATNE
jgi:MFS family permease